MPLMKKTIVVILILSFIPSFLFLDSIKLYAQEKKTKLNVGVWDFDTESIPKTEANTISERFRSRLVATDVFNVVEKAKMEEVLNEQGFQMKGCTSQECVVDAGKALNAQKMITGLIGKVGFTYTLDIRIIDIETAKIEKTVFRDYKGSIDGLLGYLDAVAKEISGIIIKPKTNYWPWITAGAVVVGGALYYLFKTEDPKPLKSPPSFPN